MWPQMSQDFHPRYSPPGCGVRKPSGSVGVTYLACLTITGAFRLPRISRRRTRNTTAAHGISPFRPLEPCASEGSRNGRKGPH
jgi:hypothetical protein